jgi:hypothetical protein
MKGEGNTSTSSWIFPAGHNHTIFLIANQQAEAVYE